MRRAKGIAVALVAVLLLAFTVSVALGRDRIDSIVRITQATGDSSGVEVRGHVLADRPRCEKRRTVFVYHDTKPPGPDDKDFKLGEVTTNDKGKWHLSSKELPDKVYAVIHKNRRCQGDHSPTEKVEYALPN